MPRIHQLQGPRAETRFCSMAQVSLRGAKGLAGGVAGTVGAGRGGLAGVACCGTAGRVRAGPSPRSEEHTSELQSLMRNSYAVFCLKKNKKQLSHKYEVYT